MEIISPLRCFFRLNKLCSLSLVSLLWYSSPLITQAVLLGAFSSLPIYFLCFKAADWTQNFRFGLTHTGQSWVTSSLNLPATFLVMQSHTWFIFISAWVHCWLMFNMMSTKNLGLLLQNCFLICSVPNLSCCCKTSFFLFLNFVMFPSTHFPSLLASLWIAFLQDTDRFLWLNKVLCCL